MQDAFVFASVFTLIALYPYWKIKQYLTKPPPTNDEIRQSPEYRAWRLAVLKRDGFKCSWCPATENLEADHIYPFAYFPELRFDIKNGRTLCRPCHEQTITYGSKAKTFYERLTNAR